MTKEGAWTADGKATATGSRMIEGRGGRRRAIDYDTDASPLLSRSTPGTRGI